MIKILLADDHKIITDGISNLLTNEVDIEIVAVCHNGKQVLNKLTNTEVDLILLDIDMPEMNGLDCAQRILERNPYSKVAMLTMHDENALIQRFIELGVRGYFLKTIAKEELLHAIKTIVAGNDYFPADVTKALIKKQAFKSDITQNPLLDKLSHREIEIVKLVAQGLSNKEISDELFISPRTADTHRSNIMKKLELHNVAGLVRFAFQNQMVE